MDSSGIPTCTSPRTTSPRRTAPTRRIEGEGADSPFRGDGTALDAGGAEDDNGFGHFGTMGCKQIITSSFYEKGSIDSVIHPTVILRKGRERDVAER